MMKQKQTGYFLGGTALVIGIAGMLSATLPTAGACPACDSGRRAGKILVADRDSGTITVIDVRSDEVIDTLELPLGENPAEPMYVYYSPIRNRVFVGDRANDRVVVYRGRTLNVEATIPAGAGVFHMWGSTRGRQLWVNNDIDNTSTVIDLRWLTVTTTVPMPADLVALGGKPHDVILDPSGDYAYVTMLIESSANDYVVQFDTETFEELGRAAVGKDPHVSLTRRNDVLYVPCQNTNELYILDRETLKTVDVLDVPGAHGVGMANNGRYLYITNLPGGGDEALWTLDTSTNEIVGQPTNSPYTVPHNVALTRGSRKLYVTHSGDNDKVTIYRTNRQDRVPVLAREVTTGANPFGLAWVP